MMLNSTFNSNSTKLGTTIIVSSIVLSSLGVIFNFLIIFLLIYPCQFFQNSSKHKSRRIGLIHSLNTYIHLFGMLVTLLLMCIQTLYGDLKQTHSNEISIPWYCHLLAYLMALFGAGVYGSCFLQAFFRYCRIMISNRHYSHNLSVHILLILLYSITISILLLPILTRTVYITTDYFCLSPFEDRLTALYTSLITVFIPVTGIFILYIKIIIYMKKHHNQTRKKRKRLKNDILIIRRIFYLVIIILQTSTTGIILWILTFFNTDFHLLFYRLLRFLVILCMIICSISLLILSPQLKRILRSNLRKYHRNKPYVPEQNRSPNNTEITTLFY